MPKEWYARCTAGNLLYSNSLKGDKRLMPEVGNGHVATKVQSPDIYAAGLYNGDAHGSSGESSHRAKIPHYGVWVTVDTEELVGQGGLALDVEHASVMQRTNDPMGAPGVQVDELWYAPLQEPALVVHEIELWNRAATTRTVTMGQFSNNKSPDLFTRLVDRSLLESYGCNAGNTHAVEGENLVPEGPSRTTFALVANRVPDTLEVPPGGRTKLYALQVVVTSLRSSNPTADAVRLLSYYRSNDFAMTRSLFHDHAAAWRRRSAEGRVEVAGDLALAQVVNASLYFLRTAVSEDSPHGISPGGLASNCYSGHTFWDQETWMYPPLLLLEPGAARALLKYRFDRRREAQAKAQQCGMPLQSYCPSSYQSQVDPAALMFPWESAHTGADVQYWGGKLGPWGRYEQHISGDVALAARQFWYATGNRTWLREVGFPLANGTASFYYARLEPRSDGYFDYRRVMGPDEYSWPVDNSGYTNAVAQIALQFAAEAAGELGYYGKPYNDFKYRASRLRIPESRNPPPGRPDLAGGYHPEYEGFPKKPAHPMAKQADTILLAYPLGVIEPSPMVSNDLDFYERITDPNGPAMTWSMFAIGWFGVKDFMRSRHHFRRGHANAQPPFGVWTEYPRGAGGFPGCVNFLTGAGGFLHSVVFGTSGLRLRRGGLHFDPPPPSATGSTASAFVLHSFHYLGWRLRQEVLQSIVRFEVLGGGGPPLCLQLEDDPPRELLVGKRISFQRGIPSSIAKCRPGITRESFRKRRLAERGEVLV